MKGKSSSIQVWSTLILLSLIWGSSFILIKKSLIAFSPIEVAMLRISISALAFSPLLIIVYRKVDWSQWWLFLIIGITGSALPSALYAIAQTEISSSIAGILNSLTPIFTLLFGLFFFGVTFHWMQLIGITLGFFGALLLSIFGESWGTDSQFLYIVLIIIGTMCYGFNVNLVKKFFQNTPPLIISSVSFSLVGFPALFYVFSSDIPYKVLHEQEALYSLGFVAVLSIFGTFISTIIFYRLVQETNAVFASSVAYMIPIVAIAWGVFDGEVINIWYFLGMAGILTGVYLIKLAKE